MSDPSPDVIVYGTVALDQFVRVGVEGEPVEDAPIRELPGGEAFNTATALAGWGVRVLLTGTAIGPDAVGDRLRGLLDDPALGLPRTHIPDRATAVTPLCTIRVFPDGERRMSGRGFREAIPPPPLPAALLTSLPLFVVDPNLGEAATVAALQAAKAGCRIVAMDFLESPKVIAAAHILVTSREWLCRSPRLAGDSPAAAAVRLVQEGAYCGIVTAGADGCFVARRSRYPGAAIRLEHVPAFDPGEIVDTTGAGDVFRAGLCRGLLRRSWPLLRTVRFAAAAAALHCQTLGGASRPPLRAVFALMRDPHPTTRA